MIIHDFPKKHSMKTERNNETDHLVTREKAQNVYIGVKLNAIAVF